MLLVLLLLSRVVTTARGKKIKRSYYLLTMEEMSEKLMELTLPLTVNGEHYKLFCYLSGYSFPSLNKITPFINDGKENERICMYVCMLMA